MKGQSCMWDLPRLSSPTGLRLLTDGRQRRTLFKPGHTRECTTLGPQALKVSVAQTKQAGAVSTSMKVLLEDGVLVSGLTEVRVLVSGLPAALLLVSKRPKQA